MLSEHPLPGAVRRLVRPTALLAFGLLVASPLARAASFGVPGTGGADPPGRFILVGADSIDPARYMALGDFAQRQTIFIEVARPGLRVLLHDPGLFDPSRPAAGQLDVNVDSTPPVETGRIRYVLEDPTGTVIANAVYGADTVATDGQLVTLHDDPAAPPGRYELDVRLLDGIESNQDVAVFGVSVPGCQAYTYNLTAGQVNAGGATISEPLRAFPLLTAGSPGTDAFGPTCGVSFVSYDLDAELDSTGAPVAPPTVDVRTRRGYAFPPGEFPPSGDARWTQTLMGGLPFGFLDSNDHGAWAWGFSDLTVPEDAFNSVSPPLDLNAFSIQVLDYDAPARDQLNWPSVPPFGDSNPRRIYLPEDDGSEPQRAYLGHSAEIVAGFPVVAQGQSSTLEVTLELGNPHPYDLAGVAGTTFVSPDPQVGDPVFVASSGGLGATIAGRRIDFFGNVPAGTVATVTYRVDILPTSIGREFLTGDDASFVSLAAPTLARYQAPYTPSLGLSEEVLGPACDIEYESVIPGCTAIARLAPERLEACPGTDIRLDATASEVINCPGGVAIFQWRANGAIVHPFPASDAITVTPYLDDTWTVEVACSTDAATCVDSDEITFRLYPELDVSATADVTTICPGDDVTLSGAIANGTPPYANARWITDPPGGPGDGSTSPSLVVAPAITTTYTYAAEDSLGCTGSGDVVITVDVPAPAISPASLAICPGDSAILSATPGFVSYAWTSLPVDPAVEGATTPDVTIRAPGTYGVTVTNATGCSGGASVDVTALPDDVPGAVGGTLRVARALPDVIVSWRDIADPASGYEVVFLECSRRDYRIACPGTLPDPPTMAASPVIGAAAAPGAESATHAGAGDLGDLIFYLVRALSPCTGRPGPVR